MGSNRVRRGQGQDMGGKTVTSRFGSMNPDFLSPLERGMVAKQFGRDSGGAKPLSAQPSPPRADSSSTGAKVAHTGLHGAPNVYTEAPGGRRGTGGKRRSEM